MNWIYARFVEEMENRANGGIVYAYVAHEAVISRVFCQELMELNYYQFFYPPVTQVHYTKYMVVSQI